MDNDAPIIDGVIVPEPVREIKRRHRTPTPKQIKALQLINQGYSKRKAMLEAGYAKSTANCKTHLVTRSRAAMEVFESMKGALTSSKLNGEYMARKFEKWLEAQKSDPDDYKTQIAAFKEFKDVVKPAEAESGLKRKITYEEFLGTENETELP